MGAMLRALRREREDLKNDKYGVTKLANDTKCTTFLAGVKLSTQVDVILYLLIISAHIVVQMLSDLDANRL